MGSRIHEYKGGVWPSIIKTVLNLNSRGLLPLSSIKRKVGDGIDIRLCLDVWCSNYMFES